jgi:hypothetical protein
VSSNQMHESDFVAMSNAVLDEIITSRRSIRGFTQDVALLADEARFWTLCGLPPGTYEVNGCAIGVPASVPPGKPRPPVGEAVIWLS